MGHLDCGHFFSGALRREPFDPLSPFHQISPSNVQTGNTLVVPPTINVDTTYTKPAASDGYNPSRTFMNHFEILNKDALVGLLIEKVRLSRYGFHFNHQLQMLGELTWTRPNTHEQSLVTKLCQTVDFIFFQPALTIPTLLYL